MAAIFEHQKPIRLNPQPGFVVKTKIVDGKGAHLYSTKVFINVCHDAQVPKPSHTFEPETVFPKIVNNEWEVPIIVSQEKTSKDKKGAPSFVYDCCINNECFQWVQLNQDLRLIVIEWCLEAIETMYEVVLEREYAMPRMLSKGELSATEISPEELKNGLQARLQELKQSETLGLIQELEVDDSEPETLPSLTDILGTAKRPLIEEIGEMSISEEKTPRGAAPEPAGAAEAPVAAPEAPVAAPESTAVPYTFVVSSHTKGEHFYLKFESPEITPMLHVSTDGDSVTITNLDARRKLGTDNTMQMALPAHATPYKSFVVAAEQALYVFCKVAHPPA